MNLRSRIKRWWIGPALYDYAVMSIRLAEQTPEKYRADLADYFRATGHEDLIDWDEGK